MDDKLTILLTLKGRPQFTLRWFEYAELVKFPFKILVADGGDDLVVREALGTGGRYPSLNYKYVRFPYDQNYSDYYAKMVGAFDLIRTPYAAIADNDDFYVVEALRESVQFLEGHPAYGACGGGLFGVIVSGSGGEGDLKGVHGDNLVFSGPEPVCGAEEKTSIERLRGHMRPQVASTWYDVHRVDLFRKSFGLKKKLNFANLALVEVFERGITLASARVKKIKTPYLIRQKNSPESADRDFYGRQGDYFDRMLASTWSGDFEGFVQALAAVIVEQDGVSLESARRYARNAYRSQVASSIIACLRDDVPANQPRSVRLARAVDRLFHPENKLRQLLAKAFFALRGHLGDSRKSSWEIPREYQPLFDPILKVVQSR